MKKLIITACILFVSGIIIAGASIAGGAFEPVDLKAQSVEFNASDITAMDIDSVLDRVEISGYSGEKVRVTYSEDLKRSCSVSVENGILKVDYKYGSKWYDNLFSINIATYVVNIEIPQGQIQNFDIDAGNSDVSLESLNGSLKYIGKSGRVSMEDCAFSDFKLEIDSGDISILNSTAGQSGSSAVITSGYGNIYIDNSVFSNTQIKNTYGNLKLTEDSFENLSVDAKSGNMMLSSIKVSDTIESKRAYGNFIMEDVSCRALIDASDNGDVKFDNLTSDYIDLKSKNGNIRGNINGAQTEYIITSNSKYGNNNLGSAVNSRDKRLNAETDSGNIIIEFEK